MVKYQALRTKKGFHSSVMRFSQSISAYFIIIVSVDFSIYSTEYLRLCILQLINATDKGLTNFHTVLQADFNLTLIDSFDSKINIIKLTSHVKH